MSTSISPMAAVTPPSTLVEELFTDIWNGDRFAADHVDTLRYVADKEVWRVFDGQRWGRDKTGEVMRRAKMTALGISLEAERETDRSRSSQLRDWGKQSQSTPLLKRMIHSAESVESMVIISDKFDVDTMLLNVRNGTIDLRTGQLKPHRADDYLNKTRSS